MLLLFRSGILLGGILYWIHLYHFRNTVDRFVMEPLVTVLYLAVSICLTLFPLVLPFLSWASGLGKLICCFTGAGLAFCLGLTFLALFLSFYPHLVPQKHANGNEPVCIVLGAPVWDGTPTTLLVSRAHHAADFLKQHPQMTGVLSGGKKNPVSEAEILYSLMREKGCRNRLLPEDKSISTDENFLFSKQLLIENGFRPDRTIVVATTPFHFYRLQKYAARCGYRDIRFLLLPAPRETNWVWCFREAIVTIRWWLLKK